MREKLKDSYSETGRPSIDPELLLRILLIGYLYGISSERKLVEELRMHLAWRWFTGLGFDQEIPRTRREEREERAIVATARKLAVLLHHLWVSGEAYAPLHNSSRTTLPAAA